MKSPADGAGRVKALKATLLCLLVLGITALMFHSVMSRQPLELDRARRAEAYRQSRIDNERMEAANARRAARGMSGLESLIADFGDEKTAVKVRKILGIKAELAHMEHNGPEWEAKTRELEALEKEIREYDQEMIKTPEPSHGTK